VTFPSISFRLRLTAVFDPDPIVCPPSLVSGNQWRFYAGQTSNGAAPQRIPDATDFEGDLDPEGPAETFVYTEKREYLLFPSESTNR